MCVLYSLQSQSFRPTLPKLWSTITTQFSAGIFDAYSTDTGLGLYVHVIQAKQHIVSWSEL